MSAKGVFQSGPDFISEVFLEQGTQAEVQVQSKVLWLTDDIRQQAEKILDRPVQGLRIRYSRSADKTAWILEEIGKEMPITIGVVVDQNRLSE